MKNKAEKAKPSQSPASVASITEGLEPAFTEPNEFLIPLSDIVGPKWNHRQIFREIEEMADSLTEHGQEEAIKVRPAPTVGKFEIVYGERRWRAFNLIASRANNDPSKIKVRCKVEALNDRGVIIQQAVENLDRDNPHPLEEALIYERLLGPLENGGQEMPMFLVVKRLRKTEEQITDRLELLRLCPDARAAYLAERFTHAHALLAARIPDAAMQMRFIADITGADSGDDDARLMSVEQARKHARKYFMLPLLNAPFSTTDADILSSAGACETCPHNSQTQTVLFRDIATEQAFCVHVPCFEQKADIAWTKRCEIARANGQDILSDADAKLVWPWGTSSFASTTAAYVPLSSVSHEFEPAKTFAELVQIAEAVGHVVRLAIARRPGTHQFEELLTNEDAQTVLRAARECLAIVNAPPNDEPTGHPDGSVDGAVVVDEGTESEQQERWKKIQEDAVRSKREQQQQFQAAMGVFVGGVVAMEANFSAESASNVLRVVARRLVQTCLSEVAHDVASRRGLKPVGPVATDRGMRAAPEAALLAFIERSTLDATILALVFELIMAKDTTGKDPFVGLREALTAMGIREEDARQGRSGPAKPEKKTSKAPATRASKRAAKTAAA